MLNTRYWTIYSLLVTLTFSLFFTRVASAEKITFIKECTYMASNIDNKASCRAIALDEVKKALLDQLATSLLSEPEVKNSRITKDQLTTFIASIVHADVMSEKWLGIGYYLKAKIAADPKEVAKSVEILQNDKQKKKELVAAGNIETKTLRKITRLKNTSKSAKADYKVQSEYNSAISKLSANDWFEQGNALFKAGNITGAIEAYNKAIELNPQYARTFYKPGFAYTTSGYTP
jgi:tetratricopeptide (TPR) repeat protein